MQYITSNNCLMLLGYASTSVTNSAVRQKRNKLYDKEKARQLALVDRVEKIQVNSILTYIKLFIECINHGFN